MLEKDNIKRIRVSYGGFYGGGENRTITHENDTIKVEREFYNGGEDDGKELYKGKTWTELIDELNAIKIDCWDDKYIDPYICDGTQWSLEIEYNDDTETKEYSGSNKFPKNFGKFMKVIEMKR